MTYTKGMRSRQIAKLYREQRALELPQGFMIRVVSISENDPFYFSTHEEIQLLEWKTTKRLFRKPVAGWNIRDTAWGGIHQADPRRVTLFLRKWVNMLHAEGRY